MNLFSLLLHIIFRLYSWSVRELQGRIRSRSPPNAHLCLIALLLAITLNLLNGFQLNHIVILSTTYYARSAIYDPHTAVILFNANERLRLGKPLLCRTWNGTFWQERLAKIYYAYEPVGVCKWTAYLAKCPVFEGFEQLALTHASQKAVKVEIPYRLPYSTRSVGVAACFSPLFYNERWQLILTTLEIYRHFGVQLQVFYLQSILEDIMRLMEMYRGMGLAELEPWASLNLDEDSLAEIGFDPNAQLDWRNQASAHTDCLLKYRESADFIIFGDVDDVLIPRLGSTYLDEFRVLSAANGRAAGFVYSRYNTALSSSAHPRDFSLSRLLSSARVATEWEDGKYVVNTSRVESAWLHYPGIRQRRTHMFTVPEDVNMMVHLRNWTMVAGEGHAGSGSHQHHHPSTPTIGARHKTQIGDLISSQALSTIQANFERVRQTATYRRLPSSTHYLPMIVDCYNTIFYSQRRRPKTCPGPLLCRLPPIPGLRCSVAHMQLEGREMSWRTKVYYASEAGSSSPFMINPNGCTL